MLQHLQGKTTIPIPELIAFGERDDEWTYVILTKLQGVMLESVWGNCSNDEKKNLVERIGKMIAEVHSVQVGILSSLEPQWKIFLDQQLTKFYDRHKRLGMPDWFTLHVENFVKESISVMQSQTELVILTCEYTPFNLLVDNKLGQWNICGMIDFGDAMIGYHEYDLIGPLLFLTEGNADLVRSLLHSYGYSDVEINQNLRRRLMLLSILHRYSNFKFQLRIPDWQERVKSIDELEELIFPL